MYGENSGAGAATRVDRPISMANVSGKSSKEMCASGVGYDDWGLTVQDDDLMVIIFRSCRRKKQPVNEASWP